MPLQAGKHLLAACLLGAYAGTTRAQSMPGMTMPGDPPASTQRPALTHKSAPKPTPPEAPMPSMPGMQMSGMHTDAPVQSNPVAPDMRDTLRLQEPEDPTHHTGTSRPAPELLGGVAGRTPITLDDLLSTAERLHPALAEANARARVSGAEAAQAKLYPNPTVGYEGDQIRGGAYGGGEQGAFVQQTVVLGGKLGLRSEVYRRQGTVDQLSVEAERLRLRFSIREAFGSALEAQAEVVLRQRLLGVALDAVETVHQLSNVGQADAPDVLQAEVEAEQSKIDFAAAQRRFLQRFAELRATAGREDLQPSPLAGSLEASTPFDAEAEVAQAMAESPELRQAEAAVAVAVARLKSARRETVPDLELRAGEQYSFEHLTDVPVRPVGPQSFASAGVQLPLFNRNQGAIQAAEAELEASKQAVARQRLVFRGRLEPMAQGYAQAGFTADRYRTELIPRAQRAYALYLGKYQSMAAAYPQVLVSQRTLFELQIGYLEALREQWSYRDSLESFGLVAPAANTMATEPVVRRSY